MTALVISCCNAEGSHKDNFRGRYPDECLAMFGIISDREDPMVPSTDALP